MTESPAMGSENRVYLMRDPWRTINLLLGWWSWLMVFSSLVGSCFILLIFPWGRRVIPAFRKMWTGEHFSYLRVSADGIMYRLWPFAEIRAGWEQVLGLRRGRWLGDSLILRDASVTGFPEFAFTLGALQISLSSFPGWQDGDLEAALRHYAPGLFPK